MLCKHEEPPEGQPCGRAISTKLLRNFVEIATHTEHLLPGEHLWGIVFVCQKSFERLKLQKVLIYSY